MRPVIGLTSYVEPATWSSWHTHAALSHAWYHEAVIRAGGTAVLLPPGPDADVVSRLDALILTGGPDLAADLYGQQAHETNDEPRADRDSFELAAYRVARTRDLPVLGICRGVQVMAVAHGGSLTQHLPDVTALSHRHERGAFTEHRATFATGSLAQRILGDDLMVNSSHHQAVMNPGTLVVTGRAQDGTIEACEDPGAPFVLGVQWHPEYGADDRLFGALVMAATGYNGVT